MNQGFSKIAICLLVASSLLSSCTEDDKFSDTPYLEWRDSEYQSEDGQRQLILTTYFTDGDGDVGRDSVRVDCQENYEEFINSYDLYIDYFEKTGGTYQKIEAVDSCLPFHNILPNITPEGQNKTLEGEISITFNLLGLPQNQGVDSVKFEMQLQDLAGNKSNIANSPAIFIPEQ